MRNAFGLATLLCIGLEWRGYFINCKNYGENNR